jgi:hypothetical protein
MSAKETTLSHYASKEWSFAHFVLTPFGAAWKPFLICAAVTGMWFFFFWGPYKEDFADLWPVSQWLWLPLLLILSGIAPMLFHHQFITRHKREKLFISFCTLARRFGYPDIAIAYVTNQRTPSKITEDEVKITDLLDRIPNVDVRFELTRLWSLSVANEEQAIPFGMAVFAYVCVWLFCLSVPFVYWSFYEELGLLGLAFVTWPVLALIYGPLKKTNQFDSPDVSWYVITDYEARARAFFSTNQSPSNLATTVFTEK